MITLETVLARVDDGSVTADDFNELLAESSPEAVRNRIRRRTLENVSDSHQTDDGHQQLELPTFADRVQPSRKPDHQQSHGRGKLGRRHSQRKQKQLQEVALFIKKYYGKPLTEATIHTLNKPLLYRLIDNYLERQPDPWFFQVAQLCRRTTSPIT